MKKIFWTTIFWIIILSGLWGYMRWFDQDLATTISSYIVKDQPVCEVCEPTICNNTMTGDSNIEMTELAYQLQMIETKIDMISQDIEGGATKLGEQSNIPASLGTTTVELYYFNQEKDEKLPPIQQLNTKSIIPVERTIQSSDNLISDTIEELIKGQLTNEEKQEGYITEFPHPQFELVGMKLEDDGTLYLQFTEVPGFTSGGSARMLLMQQSIEKTALQFPEVKKVIFIPETLFQP